MDANYCYIQMCEGGAYCWSELGETKSASPRRSLRFQRYCSYTQIRASKGSAFFFYQNITSLKPRSRPVADGMQGLSYKISSTLLQKFTHRGFLYVLTMVRDTLGLLLCQTGKLCW